MGLVGWHLGNVTPMSALDWQIIQTVPPVAVTFLADDGVSPDDIKRIQQYAPDCHFIMRVYLAPGDLGDKNAPNYGAVIPAYIKRCKQKMDAYAKVIPAGRRHLQIFNEPNMPRWSQWEGFGDTEGDMRAFDLAFRTTYTALKAHDSSWRIGFTPLTPGNRDAWFDSDPTGVPYYMHGPEAAKAGATAADIKAAIKSGPCYQSLLLADEYYAHSYCKKEEVSQPWGGLRYQRYEVFLPKPMDVWITECLVMEGVTVVSGDGLVAWYGEIGKDPAVKGTSLWILGEHNGHAWRDGDKPIRAVAQLAAVQKQEASHVTVIQEPPIQMDGRHMTVAEFEQYVAGLKLKGVNTIFLHHTASDRAQWRGYDSLLALKNYYEHIQWTDAAGVHSGWTAGPHLFVDDSGIWLFTPLIWDGVGVTGHNVGSRHIEMVGDFDKVLPSGAEWDNTVAAIGILLEACKLPLDALHFHREYENKTCPGAAVTKEWVLPQLAAWMAVHGGDMGLDIDQATQEAVRNAMYSVIGRVQGVPYNPTAAFPKFARARALGAPLTAEVDITVGGGQVYRCQGFACGIVAAKKGIYDQLAAVAW